MLSCVKAAIAHLHVPVIRNGQHSGLFLSCSLSLNLKCTAEIPEKPREGIAISLAGGLAVPSCRLLVGRGGGAALEGSNSPAASLNIDQKLLCKWMLQCQEGDISSEGDRDEAAKQMSLLIGKMFAFPKKATQAELDWTALHSWYRDIR